MLTHLQIRDGSLIPLEGTLIYRDDSYIYFKLADGELPIKELYNYGEPALITAYNNYVSIILGTGSPSYIFMSDAITGNPVALASVNGTLVTLGATFIYGNPPSNIKMVDTGNGLSTTITVENGVITVNQ